MPGLLLAVDQGTTNTKALLVGDDGQPVFRASASVELLHAGDGRLEQDPLALWRSVCAVASESASWARQHGSTIAGIALSNQRETAVAWWKSRSRSGQPAAHAISWQCPRSAALCARLAEHAPTIRDRAGLPLGTLLTAGKWAWLLEHQPDLLRAARAGELCLGTVDSWLLWKLTGGEAFATDAANASRTGLLNLAAVDWDDELLALFGIPRAALPRVCASSERAGVCTAIPELAGVPIVSLLGDSHAALAGHGCYTPGAMKATYGTGSSLMMLADRPQPSRTLARTIAWSAAGRVQYALEGNIPMTGSAVQWVGEFLGLQNPAHDAVALADSVSDSAGVVFVPAMVGLGAPWWDDDARGLVANLRRGHTAAHLARAAIDAIAYQVADVLRAMEHASGITVPALAADGGATRNARLMQLQADILGRPVHRSVCEDLSALGAAWLGGLALGWWSSFDELAEIHLPVESFHPTMTSAERDRRYDVWTSAVERARSGKEPRG